jgi:hypothetical protein
MHATAAVSRTVCHLVRTTVSNSSGTLLQYTLHTYAVYGTHQLQIITLFLIFSFNTVFLP